MNTLRGIFPEPKPVYKRNFIHENMKQIKHIQGIHNKVEVTKSISKTNHKYQNIPAKVTQYMKTSKSLSPTRLISGRTSQKLNKPLCISDPVDNALVQSSTEPETAVAYLNDSKFRETGVQTDAENSKEGKTKYASKSLVSKMNAGGDHGNSKTHEARDKLSGMSIDGNNHIDKRSSSSTTAKGLSSKISAPRPDSFQNYQRGTVPKYIRDRKKEAEPVVVVDPDCPPGHVTIPDAERKETLRALRQSYADLIAELNLLPVKTDTLRTRTRKIELEKQLDKIEEGIKVFSRPKVYVKINS